MRQSIIKTFKFILNPHLLLCLGIAWFITNGWAYVFFAFGSWFEVRWLTDLSLAYLTLLWFPFTPEKIVTVCIAIWLLKRFFPNDEKTLGVLKRFHSKLMLKNKDAKHKQMNLYNQMPRYTKCEENANAISHGLGILFGIVVAFVCMCAASKTDDVYCMYGAMIYGAAVVALYFFSCVYHALRPETELKMFFRLLDHCAIYILIAGTYTPIALCALKTYSIHLCWFVMTTIWGLTATGIVLTIADIHRYRIILKTLYIIMGWGIVIKCGLLIQLIGAKGFNLLLAGGISYTVGAIFCALGRKYRYNHFVFHIFVLAGTFLQFLCIYNYILQ